MPEILPVSLVITTLNEERNVGEFVESLLAGEALPAEIVVCDGGSSDRTVELLRAVHIPEVRIEVFVAPGATIAAGRNRAIEHAAHDVFAVTDLGCRLDTHWLLRITGPLLDDPAVDVVAGGYIETGRTLFERMAAASSIPVENLDPATFLPSSRSFAIRRSVFMEAGMYPEDLSFAGEDTALCLRLRGMGKRFAVRLDAAVFWYPRATLRSYVRQHRLYGTGDAESRSRGMFYLRTAAKWALFLGVSIPALWFDRGYLVPLVLVLGYFAHLHPKYGWNTVPFTESIGGFMLIAVKELALLAGWVKGRLRRAPRPGTGRA